MNDGKIKFLHKMVLWQHTHWKEMLISQVSERWKTGQLREHLHQDFMEVLPSPLQFVQLNFIGCCSNSGLVWNYSHTYSTNSTPGTDNVNLQNVQIWCVLQALHRPFPGSVILTKKIHVAGSWENGPWWRFSGLGHYCVHSSPKWL